MSLHVCNKDAMSYIIKLTGANLRVTGVYISKVRLGILGNLKCAVW